MKKLSSTKGWQVLHKKVIASIRDKLTDNELSLSIDW